MVLLIIISVLIRLNYKNGNCVCCITKVMKICWMNPSCITSALIAYYLGHNSNWCISTAVHKQRQTETLPAPMLRDLVNHCPFTYCYSFKSSWQIGKSQEHRGNGYWAGDLRFCFIDWVYGSRAGMAETRDRPIWILLGPIPIFIHQP